MFITVWLGIIDLAAGKMTCANAGHEFPILKKREGDYEIIKDKHDLVLGAMKEAHYNEYELQMERGSALFLYTDGLSEANNADNVMFGTERIAKELNTDPYRTPEEIIHDLKEQQL